MNFRNWMGSDCGEGNSLAQFAQHLVQDVARQDSIGQPSTSSGLAPDNFMPPQSFRMHDLMNEMEAFQPQRSYMPAITSSLDSQSTMEYPDSRNYMTMMYPSDQSPWNIGLPSPQVYWPPYPQQNFDPQWRELSEDLQSRSEIVADSLDQQDYIFQHEEPKNQPFESQFKPQLLELSEDLRNRSGITVDSLDQLDDTFQPMFQNYWRGIPIYDEHLLSTRLADTTETRTFMLSLAEYGKKCSDEECKLKNPYHKSEINKSENPEDNQLQQEEVNDCSYLKDNPVRGCDAPKTNSKRELIKGDLKVAIFYADEAARQNPEDINVWMFLQKAYHIIEVKNYTTVSVAKQILRLDPTHTNSYSMIASYYMNHCCYYEMFKAIVDWLKNHKSYGDIPIEFTMKENSSRQNVNKQTWIKSNQHIVNGVKNMLLTATQRNPSDPDLAVQLHLSRILNFTSEFNKSADCLKTMLKSTPRDLRQPQLYYDVGLNLFSFGKPYEALDYLLIGLEKCKNKVKLFTCRLIGIIFWYLTNHREAIRYFKEALDIDPSDEEFALPTRGDSLIAQNELCLQLYFKLYKKL